MSSRLRSSRLPPSKYISSNHSWSEELELLSDSVSLIAYHSCCQRSGKSSLTVSSTCRTRIADVVMKLSNSGCPTMSSNNYTNHQPAIKAYQNCMVQRLHSLGRPYSKDLRDNQFYLWKWSQGREQEVECWVCQDTRRLRRIGQNLRF